MTGRSGKMCYKNVFLALCLLPETRNVFTVGIKVLAPEHHYGFIKILKPAWGQKNKNAWIKQMENIQTHTLTHMTSKNTQHAELSDDGSVIKIRRNNTEPKTITKHQMFQRKKQPEKKLVNISRALKTAATMCARQITMWIVIPFSFIPLLFFPGRIYPQGRRKMKSIFILSICTQNTRQAKQVIFIAPCLSKLFERSGLQPTGKRPHALNRPRRRNVENMCWFLNFQLQITVTFKSGNLSHLNCQN